MSRERTRVLGGLTSAQVRSLSPEVLAARSAYLSDTGIQLDQLFTRGVRELATDHPDKEFLIDSWRGKPDNVISLDGMIERGYQIDIDGLVYEPKGNPLHKIRGVK
jgi:hypothetical protein